MSSTAEELLARFRSLATTVPAQAGPATANEKRKGKEPPRMVVWPARGTFPRTFFDDAKRFGVVEAFMRHSRVATARQYEREGLV